MVSQTSEGGMNRDEVKQLMGQPSHTHKSDPQIGFNDIWIYENQKVIWDKAANRYYSRVDIVFNRSEKSKVLGIDAR